MRKDNKNKEYKNKNELYSQFFLRWEIDKNTKFWDRIDILHHQM